MITDKKAAVLQLLLEQKLLPLYYNADAGVSVTLMQALYEAGIRMIEYTARGTNALTNFKALKTAAQYLPGMQAGIGTIKTATQANAFIDAGADFIVCPLFSKAVADATHQAGLLWIPGCMTPTEIAAAEEAGASLAKIFPGHLLGPGYITAIRELFPALRFMPTGGVEAEADNLQKWFASGVAAVGMGSKLFTPQRIEEEGHEDLKKSVRETLALINRLTMV